MKLLSSTTLSWAMKPWLMLAVLAAMVQAAFAGTIVGTVNAEGKPGMDNGAGDNGGAYANRKYKFVPKVDYSAMHDFVVYLEGPVGTNGAPSTNIVQVMTKKVAQHGA